MVAWTLRSIISLETGTDLDHMELNGQEMNQALGYQYNQESSAHAGLCVL